MDKDKQKDSGFLSDLSSAAQKMFGGSDSMVRIPEPAKMSPLQKAEYNRKNREDIQRVFNGDKN